MLEVNDRLILIQQLLTLIIQTQCNSHTQHANGIESHPCTAINLQHMHTMHTNLHSLVNIHGTEVLWIHKQADLLHFAISSCICIK